MKESELKKIFTDALEYEITESIKKRLAAVEPTMKYIDFKKEITRIRRLSKYKEKKVEYTRFGDKNLFFKWYLDRWEPDGSATCAYCGITEKECRETLEKQTKRAVTRSQHLEVEKKDADDVYRAQNCVLACYVCNNAKSDFISLKEFRPVARAINFFWRRKFPNRKIPFPSAIWNSAEEKRKS